MKFGSFAIILLLAVSLLCGGSALAESATKPAPWERTCAAYDSGRPLIEQSVLYCLPKPEQKECETQAASFFRKCGFSGDFRRIAARVRARMLLVLALGTVRSVNHIGL